MTDLNATEPCPYCGARFLVGGPLGQNMDNCELRPKDAPAATNDAGRSAAEGGSSHFHGIVGYRMRVRDRNPALWELTVARAARRVAERELHG